MFLNFLKLKNFSVYTESGTLLGQVEDLEFETNEHRIIKYLVINKKILKADVRYLISPGQIADIADNRIIVKDAAINQETASRKKQTLTIGHTASVNAEIKAP